MNSNLVFFMDVKEIRLINMQYLISSVKTIEVFADIVGSNPSYISQIQSDKSPKNVGADLARRIEKAFGKEHGWMDKLHSDDSEDLTILNDKDSLRMAIANVMGQMVSSGIYVPKKSLPHDVFASLVINELENITSSSEPSDLKLMGTQ